jgi:hypothetical protein
MDKYGYSLRLLRLNQAADAGNPGVQLGRVCIAQDVPVSTVARVLGVQRQTVYNWFCGVSRPRQRQLAAIHTYMSQLQ